MTRFKGLVHVLLLLATAFPSMAMAEHPRQQRIGSAAKQHSEDWDDRLPGSRLPSRSLQSEAIHSPIDIDHINVYTVHTSEEFLAALQSGAVHIELHNHISLAGTWWPQPQQFPRDPGFQDAMIYIPDHVLSIRGNCREPIPESPGPQATGEGEQWRVEGTQCMIVLGHLNAAPAHATAATPFAWSFGRQCARSRRNVGSVWLDNLVFRLRQPVGEAAVQLHRTAWMTNVTMHGAAAANGGRSSAVHAVDDAILVVEDSTFTGWNTASEGVIRTALGSFFVRTQSWNNSAVPLGRLLTAPLHDSLLRLEACSFPDHDPSKVVLLGPSSVGDDEEERLCDVAAWAEAAASSPAPAPAASPTAGGPMPFNDRGGGGGGGPFDTYNDPYAFDYELDYDTSGAPESSEGHVDFTFAVEPGDGGTAAPAEGGGVRVWEGWATKVYSDRPLVVARACEDVASQSSPLEELPWYVKRFLQNERDRRIARLQRLSRGPWVTPDVTVLKLPLQFSLRCGHNVPPPLSGTASPAVVSPNVNLNDDNISVFGAPSQPNSSTGSTWLFAFFGLLVLAVVPFCVVLHRRARPAAARRRLEQRRARRQQSNVRSEASQRGEARAAAAAAAEPPRHKLVVEAPKEMYRVETHLWSVTPKVTAWMPKADPRGESSSACPSQDAGAPGVRPSVDSHHSRISSSDVSVYLPPTFLAVALREEAEYPAKQSAELGDSGLCSTVRPCPTAGGLTRATTHPQDTVSHCSTTCTDAGSRACVICFENTGDHVMVPCGHGGYCRGCVEKVFHSPAALCPMCRGDVGAVVKVSLDTPVGARACVTDTKLLVADTSNT